MAWIRSQDEETLADFDYFSINDRGIVAAQVDNEGIQIGFFANREAALAELDRIEKWLEKGGSGVFQVSHP